MKARSVRLAIVKSLCMNHNDNWSVPQLLNFARKSPNTTCWPNWSILQEKVQIQLVDHKVINEEMGVCKAVAAIRHLEKNRGVQLKLSICKLLAQTCASVQSIRSWMPAMPLSLLRQVTLSTCGFTSGRASSCSLPPSPSSKVRSTS